MDFELEAGECAAQPNYWERRRCIAIANNYKRIVYLPFILYSLFTENEEENCSELPRLFSLESIFCGVWTN